MAMKRGAIWLVVGNSGSGKTTFCQGVIAAARQIGAEVRGLLCPPRFEGDVKVGIEALDLHNGEQRLLGWRTGTGDHPQFSSAPLMVGEWLLDTGVLEWGNRVLRQAHPCDLLVIDELGPLELLAGKGWQAALEALDSGEYRLALVTVRESLWKIAHSRWRIDKETLLTSYTLSKPVIEENVKSIFKYK